MQFHERHPTAELRANVHINYTHEEDKENDDVAPFA